MKVLIAYILFACTQFAFGQIRTQHITETDSVNIMTRPKIDTFKTYVRRQPTQVEHINLLYPRRSGTLALEDSSDFDVFMHGHPITKQRPPYRADPFCIYYPSTNLLLNGWFVDSSGVDNDLSCNWYGGADPSNVEAPVHGFFWNAYGQSGSIRAIDWIKVDTSHYYQLYCKVKIYHYGGFYGENPSWVFYGGLEYRYMKDSDTTFAASEGVPKWGYSMLRHYGESAITDPPASPYGYQETPTVPMAMVVGPRYGFESVGGMPDNAPWGALRSEGWDMPAYDAILTDYPVPPLPALPGFHMEIPDSGWSLYVRPKFYMEAPYEGFSSGVGNYVQISEIGFTDVSPEKSGGFADTSTIGFATVKALKDSAASIRQAIRDSILVHASADAALYATKQALSDTATAHRNSMATMRTALVDSAARLKAYTANVETKMAALNFATLSGTNTWTNPNTFNTISTLSDRFKIGGSIIGGIVQEYSGQAIDFGVNYSQLATENGFYQRAYLRVSVYPSYESFEWWTTGGRSAYLSGGGNMALAGWLKTTQLKLPALNTPPATATSTGVLGEIRFGTDGYLYLCTATNTWVRAQLITW